jgi:hypothetical protein
MKEITEIKLLETNKICVHYGKQIEVLTLKEFNQLMRARILKRNQEEGAKEIILFIILFITFFILSSNI